MTAVDHRTQTTSITGASSRFGVVFAPELAVRGSSLILVARRRDRLEALAEQLRAQHRVHVEVVAMDLRTPEAGASLAAGVARHGLQVTRLLAGAGFETCGPFHTEDPQRLPESHVVGARAAAGGTGPAEPQDVVNTALRALDRRTPPPSVAVGRGGPAVPAGSPSALPPAARADHRPPHHRRRPVHAVAPPVRRASQRMECRTAGLPGVHELPEVSA